MTDKELLERAAMAAGIDGKYNSITNHFYLADDQPDPGGFDRAWWQPLIDDGDALRLAVKLGLVISPNYWVEQPSLGVIEFTELDDGDDPYAATRRVIVRAAAEIGETL